ncbi:MAG: integration host factor subunit alpha [Tepidimonas sp.]|uniref:integration host factor subunit alpha n=1 Tax=Tepidimonas sp. TaxID=2002775 RepID=UPI00298EF762|nr:integration host factor subunit alpha [Tepidimonas sp.]MDW8336282.1 integration host factor subunit alpha [Tepidimonas sp.]
MATRSTPRPTVTDVQSTLTKAELAEALHERIGFNKRESKELVDAFFALIAERLVAGEEVRIAGFGQFGVRRKAPRPGRNPRTGELVPIAARRVVTFHASPKLREALQDGAGAASAPDR